MEGVLIKNGEKTTPGFCSGEIVFVHERNHKAIQKNRDKSGDKNREEEEKYPSHDEEN